MPVKIVKPLDFELEPTDNSRLANLCGQFNEHLHQLESHFDVGIACRSNHFQIEGRDENQRAAMVAIKNLYEVADSETLTPSTVQLYLNESNGNGANDQQQKDDQHRWSMKTSKATIKGRGRNQLAAAVDSGSDQVCNGGMVPSGSFMRSGHEPVAAFISSPRRFRR